MEQPETPAPDAADSTKFALDEEEPDKDKGQCSHFSFAFLVWNFFIRLFPVHLTDIQNRGKRSFHLKK